MIIAASILVAMVGQPELPIVKDWTQMDCVTYDQFPTVLAQFGGKAQIVGKIELAGFPGLARFVIVSFAGTMEVFGGRPDCVLVPPLIVDHPDEMHGNVPWLDFRRGDPPSPVQPGL